MTERATCWSITINNPTELDLKPELPAGWMLQGQLERGAEGTEHYQGMLTTPQVRFSAVKKVIPRAHIEVARNKAALAKYVHKDDTRTSAVAEIRSEIPTLFVYQDQVASRWDAAEFNRRWEAAQQLSNPNIDDAAMLYLDSLVEEDIERGLRGVEYIAINPMWRASWKKFWRSIIKRNGLSSQGTQGDSSTAEQAAGSPSYCESGAGRPHGSSFSGDGESSGYCGSGE